jgi:hypothetical protein
MHRARKDPSKRNWLLIGSFALISYLLGSWGYYLMLQGSGGTVFDAAYRSINLFSMKYDGLGAIPWQLEIARFISPLVALIAVGKIATSLVRERSAMFRVRFFWRNHHIVFGSDTSAHLLFTDIAASGDRVLLITDNPLDVTDDSLWSGNSAVIHRSFPDASLWTACRLDRATTLTVMADSDESNLFTMKAAAEWLAEAGNTPASPLKIYCRFEDARVRQLLRNQTRPYEFGAGISVTPFNPYQRAARMIFADHPLEGSHPMPSIQPHALVCGSGTMAENMVFWAAMIGHFAHGQRAKLTLFDPEATVFRRRLSRLYPGIEQLLELHAVDDGPDAPEGPDELARIGTAPFTSAYFCTSSSAVNLAVATRWTALPESCKKLVAMEEHELLASLVTPGGADTHIATFDFLKATNSRLAVMDEALDLIARSVHEAYYEKALSNGKQRGETGAMYAWNELTEEWRDASRAQIDHIPVKLRSVGVAIVNLSDADPDFAFSDQEIDLLARMEHERWCAQRILYGWKYADIRDDKKRLHPDLVSWSRLSEEIRDYDRNPVRHIPAQLALIGRGLCRLSS